MRPQQQPTKGPLEPLIPQQKTRQNAQKQQGGNSEATMYIANQYMTQLKEQELTINKLRATCDSEKLQVQKNEEIIRNLQQQAQEQTLAAGLQDADIEEQHKVFERINELRVSVENTQKELEASEANNKNLEETIVKLSDDIREIKASLDVLDSQRHKFNKECEDLSQMLVTTISEREKLIKLNKEIITKFLEEKKKWQSDMKQFKGNASEGNLMMQNTTMVKGSSVLSILNGKQEQSTSLDSQKTSLESPHGAIEKKLSFTSSSFRAGRNKQMPSIPSFLNKTALPGIQSNGDSDRNFTSPTHSEFEFGVSTSDEIRGDEDKAESEPLGRQGLGYFKTNMDLLDDTDKVMTGQDLYQMILEILNSTPDINAGLINANNILISENQNQQMRLQQAKVTLTKMRTQQTNDNSNRFASRKAEKMLEDVEQNIRNVEMQKKDLKATLSTMYNAISKIVNKFSAGEPGTKELESIFPSTITAHGGSAAPKEEQVVKAIEGDAYPSEQDILDVIGYIEVYINDYMLKFARSKNKPIATNTKITQYVAGLPEDSSVQHLKTYESIIKNDIELQKRKEKARVAEENQLERQKQCNNEDEEVFGFKALGKIELLLRQKAKAISELSAALRVKKDEIEEFKNSVVDQLNVITEEMDEGEEEEDAE